MTIDRPLIVLQPTTFCNIDCSYCYLPARAQKLEMSLDTVRHIAEAVFAAPFYCGEFTFLWHLGEPLVRDRAFYDQALDAIQEVASRTGRPCTHSFQTNGVLLNEEWASWLMERRIRVGISVDGPAFLHDRQRRTRRGRGTHAQVVRAVRRLQGAGVKFGAIAVLSLESLAYPDEVIGFFLDLGIQELAFNVDEIEGVHATSSLAGGDSVERYRTFLTRVLGLLAQNPGRLHLREAWKYLPRILFDASPYNLSSQALRILTFDHAGNVSAFCPELSAARGGRSAEFTFGNVRAGVVRSLPDHSTLRALQREIEAGHRRCEADCTYWRLCGGGEPSNKYFEHGRFDVAETTTCRIHVKGSIDASIAYLEQAAAGIWPLDQTLWRSQHEQRT